MKLRLEGITKIFPSRNKSGKEVIAVNDFTYEIPDGTLVGLLGPSGCGKSTTLYMICGLQKPSKGKIFFGDDDVTELTPENRGVGLVFQNYALYPHMTVKQNIMFPLENLKGNDKMKKDDMLKRAYEAARLVQIDELMDRKPSELSGGQQQRVAIARALVKMPRVLLLDEPLSNLDARLRLQTREEIKRIQRETGITTVFVTHDQDEAMSISDIIVVMKLGVVQQIGKPQDVYDNPANLFVAKFLGVPPINVIKGVVENDKLFIEGCEIKDFKGVKENYLKSVTIVDERIDTIKDSHFIKEIRNLEEEKEILEKHISKIDELMKNIEETPFYLDIEKLSEKKKTFEYKIKNIDAEIKSINSQEEYSDEQKKAAVDKLNAKKEKCKKMISTIDGKIAAFKNSSEPDTRGKAQIAKMNTKKDKILPNIEMLDGKIQAITAELKAIRAKRPADNLQVVEPTYNESENELLEKNKAKFDLLNEQLKQAKEQKKEAKVKNIQNLIDGINKKNDQIRIQAICREQGFDVADYAAIEELKARKVKLLDAIKNNKYKVFVGIRPEGFNVDEAGCLKMALDKVEIMGRDISLICKTPSCVTPFVRAIISSDVKIPDGTKEVAFDIKPNKIFVFNGETEERIYE